MGEWGSSRARQTEVGDRGRPAAAHRPRRAPGRPTAGPDGFADDGGRFARRRRAAGAPAAVRAASAGPAGPQPDALGRRHLHGHGARGDRVVAGRPAPVRGSRHGRPRRSGPNRADLGPAVGRGPAVVLPRRLQLPRPGCDPGQGPRPLPARPRARARRRPPPRAQRARSLARHALPVRPAVHPDQPRAHRRDRRGRRRGHLRPARRRAGRPRPDRLGGPRGWRDGRAPTRTARCGSARPTRSCSSTSSAVRTTTG